MSTLQHLNLSHIFTTSAENNPVLDVPTLSKLHSHLFHSFTLSFCCSLSSQEEALAGLPENRRVKMYNSNPSRAPFPPLSLLDRSLRGCGGGSGPVWSNSQCTHRLCPYCADFLWSLILSYPTPLSGTSTHAHFHFASSSTVTVVKRKFIQLWEKEYDSCVQVACGLRSSWPHLNRYPALSTTHSTPGLFQPTIMGNVFPASKLSRRSAQCILMCRYVS